MSSRDLIIEGARQNNLKNINLRLPHNKVIAVTGLSGSGKSSLAFDTIFAEGQWRFIESLSTYARLFIEKLDRPDVDAIHNIRPAIALEQKNPVKGSRSTVGTMTELYDLLRILYARVATPFCPQCGREIRQWDTTQIAAELLENYNEQKAVIMFESNEPFESLKQRGYYRLWVGGEVKDIEETKGDKSVFHNVVLDRLTLRDEPRLSDSIETAWREGKEKLAVVIFKEDGRKLLKFSSKNSCDECAIEIPPASAILFSFNHPICACPECKGFGNVLVYEEDLMIPDKSLSIAEGAIELWEKPGYSWWKEQLVKGAKKIGIDINTPYGKLPKNDRDAIYNGASNFYGIKDFFEELEGKRYKLHVRVLLSRYRSAVSCPKCGGKRLCENALAYKIDGLDIAELCDMPVSDILKWLESLHLSPMQRDIAKEALRQFELKLRFLERVGLQYLTLSRQSRTLSGGEYQRVNLSNQLASALTGTLYVLDEPTIGLHPRDTRRIAEIIRELASLGNTVIVVEHDSDIISSSDYVVEMGPGAGYLGGDVVFTGTIDDFMKSDTLTARYLSEIRAKRDNTETLNKKNLRAISSSQIILYGASGNNLKNINMKIPLNVLTAITGVSGSGKSSLIIETLYLAAARHFRTETAHPLPHKKILGLNHIRGIRLIDQSPIGKTPRSNPVTYMKIFESIRKLFSEQPEARMHGYTPGFFSFNIDGGRCKTCKGEGWQRMEMYFFEDVFVRCEECKGRRYSEDALRVTYKGKNISDVLEMTIDEAAIFFNDRSEIFIKLNLMKDMGLGYLRLGQSAATLSGGEAQRLKICSELSAVKSSKSYPVLYILDEPTVGLHHEDVLLFMKIIRKLVDAGNTVVVIEHNLDVISQADWIIDLGPEGGEAGGNILFEGSPADLIKAKNSYTGKYLKEYLYR
jgi:excinuclease ABC subunit A